MCAPFLDTWEVSVKRYPWLARHSPSLLPPTITNSKSNKLEVILCQRTDWIGDFSIPLQRMVYLQYTLLLFANTDIGEDGSNPGQHAHAGP
jgi:hypothetical protein